MAYFIFFLEKMKKIIYIFIYIRPDKCKFILKNPFHLFFFAPKILGDYLKPCIK
jgi:hypothetical protein